MKGKVGRSAGLDQAQRNTNKRMSAEPTRENEKEEPTERWKESQEGRLRRWRQESLWEGVANRCKCCLEVKQDSIWECVRFRLLTGHQWPWQEWLQSSKVSSSQLQSVKEWVRGDEMKALAVAQSLQAQMSTVPGRWCKWGKQVGGKATGNGGDCCPLNRRCPN